MRIAIPPTLGLCCLLAACGTPTDVRDYAKTAAIIGTRYDNAVSQYIASRKAIEEAHQRRIAVMERAVAAAEAMASELAIDNAATKTLDARLKAADDMLTARRQRQADADKAAEKLAEQMAKMTAVNSEIDTLAERLARLAEQQSLSDRGKFLFAYGNEAKEEFDKRRAASPAQ